MEIKVHVKTNAPESKIISRGDVWKIAIAAPPTEGRANKELVRFLRKELNCDVEIVRGFTSNKKLIQMYHNH